MLTGLEKCVVSRENTFFNDRAMVQTVKEIVCLFLQEETQGTITLVTTLNHQLKMPVALTRVKRIQTSPCPFVIDAYPALTSFSRRNYRQILYIRFKSYCVRKCCKFVQLKYRCM